jgi:hypothetical protein
MAAVDWDAAAAALTAGELPCSGGEQRIFRLAASLAGGIPVDLSDAVAGLDQANLQRLSPPSATRQGYSSYTSPGSDSDLHHASGLAIETPMWPQAHVSPFRSAHGRSAGACHRRICPAGQPPGLVRCCAARRPPATLVSLSS